MKMYLKFGIMLTILMSSFFIGSLISTDGAIEKTITVQWVSYDFSSTDDVGDGTHKTGEIYMRVAFFDNDGNVLTFYKLKLEYIDPHTSDSNVAKSVSYTSSYYYVQVHFYEADTWSGTDVSSTYGYSLVSITQYLDQTIPQTKPETTGSFVISVSRT